MAGWGPGTHLGLPNTPGGHLSSLCFPKRYHPTPTIEVMVTGQAEPAGPQPGRFQEPPHLCLKHGRSSPNAKQGPKLGCTQTGQSGGDRGRGDDIRT